MNIKKKIVKRVLLISFVLLVVFILTAVVFKQSILNYLINSKIESFNNTHQGTISIKESNLSGFSSVTLTKICLTPLTNDTLITVDSLHADLKFWSLLFGDIQFKSINIKDFKISVIKTDTTDNFSFLLKNKFRSDSDSVPITKTINYFDRSTIIFNALFSHIPEQISIQNFSASYKHNKDSVALNTSTFSLCNNVIQSVILLNDGKHKSELQFVGKIITDSRIAAFKLVQPGEADKQIPGLLQKYKANVNFDTIFFSFAQSTENGEWVNLLGKSYINHVKINQPAISQTDVFFDHLKFDFNIRIGQDYFQLDSSSTVYLNQFSFNPFIKYTVSPTKQITLKVHKKPFPSQELFSSLPEGLFHTLFGIKTYGDLSYNLDFFVDLSIPDSLKFSSDLIRHNFHIQKFGTVDFTSLESDFEYTTFEKGEPVRSFIVGSGNPNFTPLLQISPYIQNALLCTEDGAFFYHRGFIPEAFQQSIVQNIKQKRFARGGSTISMQLVKNVFLKRNKTIARKLEEVIIVWLIENQGLCSKERMFEVYLNIIEWGPNIYGITEASRFYFNKKPSELSLSESIYLSSIVPKPKYFKYCFEANGETKAYVKEFIITISNKMVEKNMISANEIQGVDGNVKITGAAKEFILPSDSIPINEIIEFKK